MYSIRVFNFSYEPEIAFHLTKVHNMNIILFFKCEPLLNTARQGDLWSFLLLLLPDSTFFLSGETQKYTNQLAKSKIVIPKALPENLIP